MITEDSVMHMKCVFLLMTVYSVWLILSAEKVQGFNFIGNINCGENFKKAVKKCELFIQLVKELVL